MSYLSVSGIAVLFIVAAEITLLDLLQDTILSVFFVAGA